MAEKSAIVSRVDEGQQAVVIVLLASNESGVPITEGQKQAAEGAAKSALELVGADVAAQSTAVMFDKTDAGTVAKLTATIETIVPESIPEVEVVPDAEEDEPTQTETEE